MATVINSVGCGLAPQECFLLMRGIKTLGVRIERAQANATVLAQMLYYKWGLCVRYPGIPCAIGELVKGGSMRVDEEWRVHASQSRGSGAVLSFTLNRNKHYATGEPLNVALLTANSIKLVRQCQLFQNTVSFGTVNSLISLPSMMSHASIPAEVRAARGLREDLVRVCVGIEDVGDLWQDLERGLYAAGMEPVDAEYSCLPVVDGNGW